MTHSRPTTDNLDSHCVIVYTGAVSRGNPGEAAAGAVLSCQHRSFRVKVHRYLGYRTNNDAEYQALLMALKNALERGFRRVVIRSSSELMINQLNGAYSVRHAALVRLHREATTVLKRFDSWHAEHVPRHQNGEPYRLANKAITLHQATRPQIVGAALHDASREIEETEERRVHEAGH